MKRILTTLCALALVMTGSATALAAEAASDSSYYPISVEEYTYGDFDELRINKTYRGPKNGPVLYRLRYGYDLQFHLSHGLHVRP